MFIVFIDSQEKEGVIMEGIQSFNSFTYKTVEGENVTVTKKDGVVTLAGDKNGIRQMPLEDFKKEFMATVPKLERTPSVDTVNFSSNEKTVEENKNPKKEASIGKKLGVGIASGFMAGLGQAINGEWGKATGFFLGSMALSALACTVSPFIAIPALGISAWSIVDAVNNAKAD